MIAPAIDVYEADKRWFLFIIYTREDSILFT